MDFNVKKLASDAGVFFTRAVQVGYQVVLFKHTLLYIYKYIHVYPFPVFVLLHLVRDDESSRGSGGRTTACALFFHVNDFCTALKSSQLARAGGGFSVFYFPVSVNR